VVAEERYSGYPIRKLGRSSPSSFAPDSGCLTRKSFRKWRLAGMPKDGSDLFFRGQADILIAPPKRPIEVQSAGQRA
jgi:hypothetical protein